MFKTTHKICLKSLYLIGESESISKRRRKNEKQIGKESADDEDIRRREE
jgi:hypothetical protein